MEEFNAAHGLNFSSPAQGSFLMLAGQMMMVLYYVVYILVIMRIIISLLIHFSHHLNLSARVPDNFRQFVLHITDPLLRPFTLIIPIGHGAVDVSPVILLKCLEIARNITVALAA